MSNTRTLRQRLGTRTAVIAAGAIGFALGGVSLVAANHGDDSADDNPSSSIDISVSAPTPSNTIDDSSSTVVTVDTPATLVTAPETSSPAATVITVDDSVDDSIDANTSSSTPNTVDDDTSSTTPNTVDDDTSTSGPGSSVPTQSLPDPFTRTYSSAGGSITVSWSGSAFTLVSVTPADGFSAEIEDARWDRIRVDFEGGDDDTRIEVRISDDDGSLRVNID
ncbi:MAG: hypothetical protein Q8M22_09395 [Actinomycetota bacterium]|nr:hypothetical protein [Actinomycetota bacterium]